MTHYYFIQIENTRKFAEVEFIGDKMVIRLVSLFGIRSAGRQVTVNRARWATIKEIFEVTPADRLHRLAVSVTIDIDESLLA